MVFHSFMLQRDQVISSQITARSDILFSFFTFRMKKIILTNLTLFVLLILLPGKTFGFAMAPGWSYPDTWQGCSIYQGCNNNFNYYGGARGFSPPVYFYPQLPYQSMWPQQNYYFPHTASPYQPVDCPFCNQQQNYQQPMFFPNSYQFQGGGIT